MAVTVEGVPVKDLKRAVRKRWRNVDEYRAQHVAPVLVERGLLKELRPARRAGGRSSTGPTRGARRTRS